MASAIKKMKAIKKMRVNIGRIPNMFADYDLVVICYDGLTHFPA